jgi:hypothetical protein
MIYLKPLSLRQQRDYIKSNAIESGQTTRRSQVEFRDISNGPLFRQRYRFERLTEGFAQSRFDLTEDERPPGYGDNINFTELRAMIPFNNAVILTF